MNNLEKLFKLKECSVAYRNEMTKRTNTIKLKNGRLVPVASFVFTSLEPLNTDLQVL